MLKQIFFENLTHDEAAQLRFFNSYRKMANQFGCYYMGYILEDLTAKLRLGFTTNMLWGKEYLNKYIHVCHLWNQVQSFYHNSLTSSLILPWNIVPISSPLQKDIILRREELLIGTEGISFCKKTPLFREYYYFAPEIKQRNFLRYVASNIDIIRAEVNLFRVDSLKRLNDYKIKG